MKRLFSKRIIAFFLLVCIFLILPNKVKAASYLADKAETEIKLDVPGALSLCQSDDGYMWIGQYSGITKYDSNKFEKFTEFYEGETKYDIKSVKSIISYENMVFFSAADHLYKYDDGQFNNINLGKSNYVINELTIYADRLYVSTTKGLFIYEITTDRVVDSIHAKEGIEENIVDCVVIDNYIYYQKIDGIYNINNEKLYANSYILDMINYNDIIITGDDNGLLNFYDTTKKQLLEKTYDIEARINRLFYSEIEETVFIAADTGLYSINLGKDTGISNATNLKNNDAIVDLLIDYEGNLWFATYNIGVSMLSKNALSDLLFDVADSEFVSGSRRVNAIEKNGNLLYIVCAEGIKIFDLVEENIISDNPIQSAIQQYIDNNSISNYSYNDAEIYKNCIYFAVYGVGLVEYSFTTKVVNIYDGAYINTSGGVDEEYSYTLRCLRAFDDFLIIGYRYGMMKFDNGNFKVTHFVEQYPLYISKDPEGNINFAYNHKGVYYINNNLDYTSVRVVGTNGTLTDGVLKFMYDEDGKVLYFTSFGTLYKSTKNGNNYDITEINIPNVKGSIVELSKVEITDQNGETSYRYVLASENQVYIAKEIKNGLNEYQVYDSTNGLKNGIAANTSGFYDKENNKYYFQSKDGVFTYDFSFENEAHQQLKIKISSIIVDNETVSLNNLKLKQNVDRITFNISVFAFRPNKGYKVYYKLSGVDKNYVELSGDNTQISYTNLKGGKYTFSVYVLDESGQESLNKITYNFSKTKKIQEHVWFIVLMVLLALLVLVGGITLFFIRKMRISLKRQLEYKKITLESIEAIARTIDAKDSYTNGHSRRVGYYSREIAKAMGLPEKEVENIFYTALLHDIGKIGIPIKIINKPSRLDDEEFEIMKTHTIKGGKILKDISTIPGIVEGAMYHHEKYNGSGYPTGLKGEDIPLNARIICCADCFDAMATKRSYKPPCGKDYIISEFERCKGTQFDPEIADVIIKLIKEDKFKTILEEDTKHKNDDIVTIEDSKETE